MIYFVMFIEHWCYIVLLLRIESSTSNMVEDIYDVLRYEESPWNGISILVF